MIRSFLRGAIFALLSLVITIGLLSYYAALTETFSFSPGGPVVVFGIVSGIINLAVEEWL